jgi:Lrp/AsnC family leucine-responsive transcriptional regulator
MDATDYQIVRLLQRDGRLSHEQIAREVHLSRPAVHERIKRLEQEGVLRGYTAEVDWGAVGLPLTAFVWIRTTLSCLPAGRRILDLSSESLFVEECHRVAGEWCLLVKVHAASSLALQDLLDDIAAIPGVQNTMTTVALSTLDRAGDVAKPREASAGFVRLSQKDVGLRQEPGSNVDRCE